MDENMARMGGTATRIAAAVALAGFAFLHVAAADRVDPLRQPVSSYALGSPGDAVFAASAFAVAAACGLTALAFLGRSRPAVWGLSGAAVMYVLVVVFPTDAGVAVSTFAGQVHRYAAGAAFVGVTGVAVWLAVTCRGGRHGVVLRWLAIVSVVTLLITTVNTFLPWLADGGSWRGLPQRALLFVHIGFLWVMGARDRRTESPAVVPAPEREVVAG
ncbi:uncharacterized protein DUF998 [Stackebrandtia albiflava]|uniref:Uncharacterized protein DUF998 n=1 Tax=Stackebrandtia albiflava TaxID=406432 RepID=A0A562UXY3_9ACTN|nr:DUF998 domain-containing protein [Stackebrandtia albiflava]TWJ10489.1 uncharacterized protein DUF998 [Stackebrandtia albiflava]